MPKDKNPFEYLDPVRADKFLGRTLVVEHLKKGLTKDNRSYACIGGRRSGKTSLLFALQDAFYLPDYEESGAFVISIFVNFQDMFNAETEFFEHVLDEICNWIEDNLKDYADYASQFEAILHKATLKSTFRQFKKGLKAILNILAGAGYLAKLVLLLDEVDLILETKWHINLFNNLRDLISISKLASDVCLVLTGSQRLFSDLRGASSPLHNVLDEYYLEVFSYEDILSLIERAGNVPKNIKQAIWQQSGGHPFFAQYLLYHLWEKGIEQTTHATVDTIINTLLHERTEYFERWERDITPLGLEVYEYFVNTTDWIDEIAIDKVKGKVRIKTLTTLYYHGFIVHDGAWKRYRRAGELFQRWFLIQHKDEENLLNKGDKLMALDTKVLQALYNYFQSYEGDPEMELNELIAETGETRSEVIQTLHTLGEKDWVILKLAEQAESGTVKLTAPGRKIAKGMLKTVSPKLKPVVTQTPPVAVPKEEIKILFLAANPLNTDQLQLGKEARTIEERLRSAEFRTNFKFISQWAVRRTDLSEYLLRYTPHIVHFSGHGGKSGKIILEDENGQAQAVPPKALSGLFRILKDNIKCVVLNACLSLDQAEAINKEIDCVVGMSAKIADKAAIGFAGGFYRGLGYGRSIQTAFDLGCNEIDLASLPDDATPKLCVKTGINAANIVFVNK